MEKETICKEGIVRAVEDNQYKVEITISSACSECHAKSICLPSDQKQEFVMARSLYGNSFAPGEKVQLVLKGTAGRNAVLLAYALPLVILMAALFGTYAITHSELAGVIASIVFVVAYYFFLKRHNKKLEEQFQFYIK